METGGTESTLSECITPLSGRRARLRALFDRDLYSIVRLRCTYMAALTIHERFYTRYVSVCFTIINWISIAPQRAQQSLVRCSSCDHRES